MCLHTQSGRFTGVKLGGTAGSIPVPAVLLFYCGIGFFYCPAQRKDGIAMKNEIPYKIYLSESELPNAWYNVRADMKNKPAPLLNPGTGKPVTFDDLAHVFCDELVKQELDEETPMLGLRAFSWSAEKTY